MPELPEVETVRRGLHELIVGLTIKSVDFDYPKGFPNSKPDVNNFVIGAQIIGIRRRAKVLLIDLNSNYTLVTHLKMTGQMVFVGDKRFGAGHPNDSLIGSLPDKSTRVDIEFTDSSRLFFNDQRKFGWMKLLPTPEVPEMAFMQKVGPEPLNPNTSLADFSKRLFRRKNSNIKATLLDQSVIAGVGNIYADESLWLAKMHPKTLVGNLNDQQVKTLFIELKSVLQLAIDKGGSSDRNYIKADGSKGSYLDFANVFRREGLPCPRCRATIIKTRVASRGTHTCPICQKEPS